MVEVRIAGLVKRKSDEGVVVLLDEAGRRAFCLWVWMGTLWMIDLGWYQFPMPRPFIFDLVGTLLETTGAALEAVRLTAMANDTVYAVARIRCGDAVQELSADPGDAIALAVRTGSPIYIAESVLALAGVPVPEPVEDGGRSGRRLSDAALDRIVAEAAQARLALQRQTMAVDRVVEGLYIGGVAAVHHAAALREAGITHVLKLSTADQGWPDDFTVFDNALPDSEFVPLEQLRRGVAFIREQRQAGRNVLVACHAGVSRSSTFVLAYLLEALGYDLREAWQHLHAQHPIAWPMPQMWESLLMHYHQPYTMADVREWLEAARPEPVAD